ncbi:MAG: bifunctional adenosylcobinamide kinase/adenosylcobinamide-phosphate guanylyltransferase [Propionicimonas sp.]
MARVLVTGGVRSGKSRYAEGLLDPGRPAVYVTPGYPADPLVDADWAARVAAHQVRRPAAWHTTETLGLADSIRTATAPVLVDCLGTWVTRLIDSWQAWDIPVREWLPAFDDELSSLTSAVATRSDVVLVTNEVGWGVVSEHRSARVFADQLGRTNQAVAEVCDQVVLMVAGRPLTI